MKFSVLSDILAVYVFLLPVCSCTGGNSSHKGDYEEIPLRYSRNFRMEDTGEGCTIVSLRNPWDTTKTQAVYALVDKGRDIPSDLRKDAIVLRTPLEKSVVYSSVHVNLLDELGAFSSISGVCDPQYILNPKALKAIEDGSILDCGNSMAPNMEKIIASRPGAVLLSPYENSNDNVKFANTGIPVVLTADYMESTPLARAEWMRFYGRLFGKGAEADSLFAEVEKNYMDASKIALGEKKRPMVLFDLIYSNIWNVPTSGSVTGRLIEDAGGTNPFAEQTKAGSAQLSPEEVLVKAQNADIWLIRYNEPKDFTLTKLADDNPMYQRFKAYKDGNVYVSDTSTSGIFEDGSFHPDRVLKEMVRLIHPEKAETLPGKSYYEKVDR